MKNKAGTFLGFVLGTTGFLALFKVIVLDRVSPDDEMAPGIVVLMAIVSGFVFSMIGHQLQKSLTKARKAG